jgi:phage baseplate assembly protein W
MAKIVKNISSRYYYDIDKNPIDVGEIWDGDVLNQSIEMILGTMPSERLFNSSFGYGLQYRIFNIMSPDEAESILDEVASAIKKWEDRITLLESQMRIIGSIDKHTMIIVIPYVVKRTGITSIFKKKLVSN